MIRLGEIKSVANTKRKFGSKAVYYATYIEFKGDISPILFTLDELTTALSRCKVNISDLPPLKKSWIELFLSLFKKK